MDSWWTKQGQQYSIGKAYKKIKNQGSKVVWDSIIWNRLSFPKHRFTWWLAMLERLQAKQRLMMFGVCTNNLCCLCSKEIETHHHLFYECPVTVEVWKKACAWLGVKQNFCNMQQLVYWTKRGRAGSAVKTQVFAAMAAAVLYNIWHARNQVYWKQNTLTGEQIYRKVQSFILIKCRVLYSCKLKCGDKTWIDSLYS